MSGSNKTKKAYDVTDHQKSSFTLSHKVFENPVICSSFIYAVAVLVSLCIFLPKANGIFFPQDEFGYWGNAASYLGFDWSELLAKQSKYAYGYSMLLLPLMRIFRDPVLMYRAALCVNALLTVLSSGLISGLILRLDKDFNRSKTCAILICLVCSFFSPLLIYMHYTIAESLLFLEFYALCHITLDISEGRIDPTRLITGGIISFIMMLTHYRTVGLFFIFLFCAALVLYYDIRVKSTSCLFRIQDIAISSKLDHYISYPKGAKHLLTPASSYYRKQIDEKDIPQSAVIFILIFFGIFVTALFIICGHFGFYFEKRTYDLATILVFAAGILGKILYIGASNLGLGLVGIFVVFKEKSRIFNIFILLGVIYMIILGSFYFSKDPAFVRLDHLIYGRYEEIFIPLLIYFGLRYMLEANRSGRVVMGAMIIMGVIAVLLTFFVSMAGIKEYVRDFVSGIDWMFLGRMPIITDVYEKPFIISCIGLAALYYLLNKNRISSIALSVIAVLFLITSFFMTYKHVYVYQEMDASDLTLSYDIRSELDAGKELYFLDSPYNDYIDIMQFFLMDEPIHITEGLDAAAYETPFDAIVITHANYEDPEQLLSRYSHNETSAHFVIYYN